MFSRTRRIHHLLLLSLKRNGIGSLLLDIYGLGFVLITCIRPYSRQTAAYPAPWLLEKKFWPTVSRVDDGKSTAVVLILYL